MTWRRLARATAVALVLVGVYVGASLAIQRGLRGAGAPAWARWVAAAALFTVWWGAYLIVTRRKGQR